MFWVWRRQLRLFIPCIMGRKSFAPPPFLFGYKWRMMNKFEATTVFTESPPDTVFCLFPLSFLNPLFRHVQQVGWSWQQRQFWAVTACVRTKLWETGHKAHVCNYGKQDIKLICTPMKLQTNNWHLKTLTCTNRTSYLKLSFQHKYSSCA